MVNKFTISVTNEPDRVEVVFHENLDLDTSLQATRQAKRLAVENGLGLFLVDISGVEMCDTKAEQFKFVLAVTQENIYEASDSIATVVSPYTADHDFVEMALQDQGCVCRQFRSHESAIAWLEERP